MSRAVFDPAALRARCVGKGALAEFEHHERIDSTNRRAAELGREGATAPVLVLAEEQTAGRGRQGRSWESPRSENFYGSFLLRPDIPAARIPPLTLVAALAVRDAIDAVGVAQAGIKWPNDLLLGGRKTAGILTEMEIGADGVAFVVVGIGVNLNLAPGEIPPELREKATSLAIESGQAVDRAAFAEALCRSLLARMARFEREGFEPFLSEYEQHHILAGQEVEIVGGEGGRGRVVGVDAGGALLLDTATGRRALHAGEVSLSTAY